MAKGRAVNSTIERRAHASPAITLQTHAHEFGARDIVSAEAMNDVVAQLLPI